jgi:hypothetical protein
MSSSGCWPNGALAADGAVRAIVMRRLGIVIIVLGALLWPAAALGATSPALVGSVSNASSLSGAASVAVSGNYAYTTAYWAGQLTAVDISNPANPTVAGSSSPLLDNNLLDGSSVNIAGGYAFVVSKNRNLGSSGNCTNNINSGSNDDGTGNSLTILDIHTNPAQPTVVGTVRDPSQLFGAYGVAVSGNYAYVATQGVLSGQPCGPDTSYGGFAVIDITNPAGPTIVKYIDNGSLPSPWTGQNVLKHATSVAISGNYAYVTAFYDSRLTIINISNPTSPTIVGSLRDAVNLPWPADVAVQGNYAYVANQAYGSTSQQFTVVDVSNPAQPRYVTSLSDSSLLAGAYRIRLRGNFAYIAGQGSDSIAAIDISDPTQPRIADAVVDPTRLNSATGLDLDQSGRYVIAASPRLSGDAAKTYAPYPLQIGGPPNTGTISVVDLDPSPISVTIASGSEPANPTTQTSASFSFSVSDTVSTVQCRLDGGPFGPCSTPTTQSYSALGAGSHTFTVQATDATGKPAIDSYTWLVGTTSVGTAPVNSVRPQVSGAAALGQTLSASTGTWSGTPTPSFSYQWQRCDQNGQSCIPISGSTGASYTAQRADVGVTVRDVITAVNGAGSASAASAVTARVSGPPMVQTPPKISGSARQGSQLSGSAGTWSSYPAASFTYRWERCNSRGNLCSAISGQTKSSYAITVSDVGSTLRFLAVAANSSGSATAVSPATAVVSAGSKTAQTTTWHAVLSGVSARRPNLRITISTPYATALVNTVTVSLPKGLSFLRSKKLVKGITVKDLRSRRLTFDAVIKHGLLLLTPKRPVTGLEVVVSSQALAESKGFRAEAKGPAANRTQVTVTVAEADNGITRGRLKLRLV